MISDKIEQKKILVAVNNHDELKIIKDKITDFGLEVITAHSGDEALIKITELLPDMIIIDRQLKKMSGIKLLFRLFFSHPGIKLVLMSSNHAESITVNSNEGFLILKKPVSTKELEEVFRKASLLQIKSTSVSVEKFT